MSTVRIAGYISLFISNLRHHSCLSIYSHLSPSFLFNPKQTARILNKKLCDCFGSKNFQEFPSMSPAKLHGDEEDEHSGREIKGPRPSPLKINKASQVIQKPSSTSSTSISSVSDCVAPARQQQRRPVIIYTHSPKIIHTQARDFMALVQKLTGVSRPNDGEANVQPDYQTHKKDKRLSTEAGKDRNVKPVSHDDNESSSALTDENCGGGGRGEAKASSSSLSPSLNLNQTHPFFADIPLFTPNSNSFFCSPRPVYRYPDSAYASPNVSNSMSPSVFEFMKGLPEY